MTDTMIKPMTKQELTDIVINEYSHVIGDSEWEMLDSEADAINKDQQTRSADAGGAGSSTHEQIIECLWRMDYKTHRLIQEGYMCLEDAALFASEQDAVDYINEVTGESYKDFNEVSEAVENGDIADCYFTDWL
ncbi:hypothetical protein ACTXIV_02605 [Psychrobacter celer]|uniref:hypothetical protein n=1 Tax=Psychrobacter celer TaxID=306572 RepID=UPI003FD28A75